MLYGKGIKDDDDPVSIKDYYYVGGKRKSKTKWNCPYYSKWSHMLKRCYSEDFQEKYPSYKDCIVCKEWLTYSNFKDWCVAYENREGISVGDYQLDKDILSESKIYSPKNCILVTKQINSFIIEKSRDKGLPTGVCYNTQRGKLSVYCRNPFTKKTENLGYAGSQEEGHSLWKQRKLEHVEEFKRRSQICEVIYKALKIRYS